MDAVVARRILEALDDNGGIVDGPFGLSFDKYAPSTVLVYSALNIAVNAFVPVPLSGAVLLTGVLLYGWFYGFILSLVTSVIGCYLCLVVTRMFRPTFLSLLGKHTETYSAVDAALVRQGFRIPLLLRLTPVAPVVLCNVLLSLTSIDPITYVWTTFVGFIPASIPYAYAAVVGMQVLTEFPPSDPVMVSTMLVGLVATVLTVWKVGEIAMAELSRSGVAMV